jgi:hypothetical protein
MIPPAVLRQLYVQGSLTNTPEGATFRLKNSPTPATVIGLEIAVDGQKVPPEKNLCRLEDREKARLNWRQRPKFNVRDEVTILAYALPREAGDQDKDKGRARRLTPEVEAKRATNSSKITTLPTAIALPLLSAATTASGKG